MQTENAITYDHDRGEAIKKAIARLFEDIDNLYHNYEINVAPGDEYNVLVECFKEAPESFINTSAEACPTLLDLHVLIEQYEQLGLRDAAWELEKCLDAEIIKEYETRELYEEHLFEISKTDKRGRIALIREFGCEELATLGYQWAYNIFMENEELADWSPYNQTEIFEFFLRCDRAGVKLNGCKYESWGLDHWIEVVESYRDMDIEEALLDFEDAEQEYDQKQAKALSGCIAGYMLAVCLFYAFIAVLVLMVIYSAIKNG